MTEPYVRGSEREILERWEQRTAELVRLSRELRDDAAPRFGAANLSAAASRILTEVENLQGHLVMTRRVLDGEA